MNRKHTLLNQLRKLESRSAELHDLLNSRFGAAHEMTKLAMWNYALVFSCQADAEYLFDEQALESEDE